MREGPSSEVLAGAAGWRAKLSSWRDGRVLAEDIPILSGRLVGIGDAEVPERLTFSVPEWADETSWRPDGVNHPLGKYGQTIDVSIFVTSSVTRGETQTRLGQYRVFESYWDDLAGVVRVTAFGVLHRVKEDALRVPEVPRDYGTFASEFRRLMTPGVPVIIHPSLVDRKIPNTFAWEQSRLRALYEIAAAWPARVRTDQWGVVHVLPPLPETPTPVLTLKDGEGGTVISAPRTDTREGVYNVIVVTARPEGADEPIRVVAEQTSGELAVTTNGTGYGSVVGHVSNPLIQTHAEATLLAQKELADALRPAIVRPVTLVPDPRVDLDDAVELIRGDRDPEWGWVVGYDLPLTVDDGDMRLDVGVVV